MLQAPTRLGWVIALLGFALLLWPARSAAQLKRGSAARGAIPTYALPPLLIGTGVEAVYDALRVPPALAEPCLLTRDDMTVTCRLGVSHIYKPGTPNFHADALPVPADSLELRVLSEARVLIGYVVFYTTPPAMSFDSVRRMVRYTVERAWGRPAYTVGGCTFWDTDSATTPSTWQARLCATQEDRTVQLAAWPNNAQAARAALTTLGARLSRPLDAQDLPAGDDPWWVPLWRPLTVGALEPGRSPSFLAAAAGVRMDVAHCHGPEDALYRDSLNVACEWGAPDVTVAGFQPTRLDFNIKRDPARRIMRVNGIWLQFGAYTHSKDAVVAKCRSIAAALIDTWGAPTQRSAEPTDCHVTWNHVPFRAVLSPLSDKRRSGQDVWTLSLYLGVHPAALPPQAWQR